MINAILAVSSNNVIGDDTQLPWYIPEDLKRFKQLTLNNKVVMGSDTWRSLPKRPLPQRENYVLSKNRDFILSKPDGAKFLSDVSVIQHIFHPLDNVFIIGGAKVFKQAFNLDIIQKVYLTYVNNDVIGDKFFDFSEYSGKFKLENKSDWFSHNHYFYQFQEYVHE